VDSLQLAQDRLPPADRPCASTQWQMYLNIIFKLLFGREFNRIIDWRMEM
jgi:hypothetical protein